MMFFYVYKNIIIKVFSRENNNIGSVYKFYSHAKLVSAFLRKLSYYVACKSSNSRGSRLKDSML